MTGLVSIGRFLDPAEAQMAKGMLEAAGIPCFILGEHANALYPMALRARLQVRPEDEMEAQVMLLEAESMADQD